MQLMDRKDLPHMQALLLAAKHTRSPRLRSARHSLLCLICGHADTLAFTAVSHVVSTTALPSVGLAPGGGRECGAK